MSLELDTHHYAEAVKRNDLEYLGELREELQALNELLEGEGLPAHEEPEHRGTDTARDRTGSVPYSFVHYLRRAYACSLEYPDRPLEPVAPGVDPADDPAVDKFTYRFDSHLVCHSDCEGYYLPVEFDHVLFPDDELEIPGGMVGSSVALLRELVYVAPYLGIALDNEGELSDNEIESIYAAHGDDDDHPFYRERETWVLFYEAARISVTAGTVITFC
ncbi:hypothetical protein HGA13_33120 [Nocardia speluncae]|uniref:Uncharacterized protein n=1 Tax=Nocardia speluncae TaxID=419477 RepID=A0A846XTS8_9NOCA|nr:hypothetical protein [Nocardia speluncae]NKY37873.1 hypothetical protein [Nocardia speluncae]